MTAKEGPTDFRPGAPARMLSTARASGRKRAIFPSRRGQLYVHGWNCPRGGKYDSPELLRGKKEQTPLPRFTRRTRWYFTADISVFQAHLPGSLWNVNKNCCGHLELVASEQEASCGGSACY